MKGKQGSMKTLAQQPCSLKRGGIRISNEGRDGKRTTGTWNTRLACFTGVLTVGLSPRQNPTGLRAFLWKEEAIDPVSYFFQPESP